MHYSIGCGRTGKSNQRPIGRIGRRTGDGRREKQSSRKTGYAGICTGGYASGVCGKNGIIGYDLKNNKQFRFAQTTIA